METVDFKKVGFKNGEKVFRVEIKRWSCIGGPQLPKFQQFTTKKAIWTIVLYEFVFNKNSLDKRSQLTKENWPKQFVVITFFVDKCWNLIKIGPTVQLHCSISTRKTVPPFLKLTFLKTRGFKNLKNGVLLSNSK